MKAFVILLLLVLPVMSSCRLSARPDEVKIDENQKCGEIGTECVTDHQGEHSLDKCDVFIDNDTLVILFPAELPAYWGSLEMRVYGGKWAAKFDGVSFAPEVLSFETIRQELILGKTDYSILDTLCGYCDITFREINQTTGQASEFYFKGTINEIIRDKSFDPFNKDYFMTFDLPTAIHELGEPQTQETFNMTEVHEFRIELLRFFPEDKDIELKELTWDISEDRDISDEGKERLTIWYACSDGRWTPVHYMRWDAGMQF